MAQTRFDVASYGTELLALDLRLAVQELKGLGRLDFDVALDVVDTASFLTARSRCCSSCRLGETRAQAELSNKAIWIHAEANRLKAGGLLPKYGKSI